LLARCRGEVRLRKKSDFLATSFKSVDVKCPFYVCEDYTVITCAGALEGSDAQKHTFKNKKLKEKHKQAFCNNINCYEYCRIFEMINENFDFVGR